MRSKLTDIVKTQVLGVAQDRIVRVVKSLRMAKLSGSHSLRAKWATAAHTAHYGLYAPTLGRPTYRNSTSRNSMSPNMLQRLVECLGCFGRECTSPDAVRAFAFVRS